MMKQSACWQRVVLAVILAVGFAVVWGYLSAWVAGVIATSKRSQAVTEYLRFRMDGTPLIQSFRNQRYDLRQYRDLAGNDLDISDEEQWLYPVSLPARWREGCSPEVSWDKRMRAFADNRRIPDYWFFVSDGQANGSAYLVGYDSLTNARVGFLGTAGFRDSPLPGEERFPFLGNAWAAETASWGSVYGLVRTLQGYYVGSRYPLYRPGQGAPGEISPWQIYVQTRDNQVYQVDLSRRMVSVVREGMAVRSINLDVRQSKIPEQGIIHLAARTADEILMVNARNVVTSRFPIPEELRERDLNLAETATGEHLAYWTEGDDDFSSGSVDHIYWFDAGGQVRRREDVHLQDNRVPFFSATVLGILLTVPTYTDGAAVVYRPSVLLETGQAESYPQALKQALGEFWPALLVVHLLSAGLAVGCYRRQARYAVQGFQRIFWPLFVFIVGLPGWIGYRYSRFWPVLERCPSCGGVVARDQVACACCRADFPMPAFKGTEIYA